MLIEKIINTAFSFGAAIVVFGAWAKLEHKDFSDTALTAGMLVETGIFCIYGLLEWQKKKPARQEEVREPPAQSVDVGELTNTMKQTNQILNKVFR
jgi:hypothetical protein